MGISESSTHTTFEQNGETGGHIVIAHTNEEGTLVRGTSRGDGSHDALRASGFRWSRNLGIWYMRKSRGFAARRERIDTLAAALRAAGFVVTVNIEEYDPASTFQARQNASEESAEANAERAERERGRSDARQEAAHAVMAMIPLGQPILVGHHSERRHRRDLERRDRNIGKAIEHGHNADRAGRRSDSVRAQAEARESPVVMGRKVARLEAEQRQLARRLASTSREYVERLRVRQQVVEEDLVFLRELIKRSKARLYTRADIQKGDIVQLGDRGWHFVVKANPKTVAVKTSYTWTSKYPYHEVTGHRRPECEPGGVL